MKNFSLALGLATLISTTALAQNAPPVLSNITALADTILHKLTITYDVSDAENDSLEVFLNVSTNGGAYFSQNTANAVGDVGFPVMSGTTKYIWWNYPDSLSTMVSSLQVKLVADDRAELITIPQILAQLDSNRMKQTIQWMEGIRHRTTGPAHLQEIRDSLLTRFQQAGLDTSVHAFPYNTYTGKNIIGRKPSTLNDGRTFILDGHYDTVNDSPGADDNGSSIAGILEILRLLAPLNLTSSIDFIAFDLEEQGLLGSKAFVPAIPPDEQIEGVINMDMIAFYSNEPNSQEVPAGFDIFFPDLYARLEADSFRGNFIISTANTASKPLATLFDSMATRYVPDLLVGTIIVPGVGTIITDARRSDHAAFWDAGYNALHLSDGAETRNPNYHAPGDTESTLNYTFMYNITKAAAATLLHLTFPEHADSKTATVTGDPASAISLLENGDCKIAVSPNPTNGIFKVTAQNCSNENLNVKLVAMDGKVIRVAELSTGIALEFNEHLKPGYYLVEVSNSKKVYSEKVLIR